MSRHFTEELKLFATPIDGFWPKTSRRIWSGIANKKIPDRAAFQKAGEQGFRMGRGVFTDDYQNPLA